MARPDTIATVVLVGAGAELATWPLASYGGPDLAVVDRLARLQLVARRLGFSIQLRDACPALVDLLDLLGLSEVIALRQVGGESECGEQVGVEEVVVSDDPVA